MLAAVFAALALMAFWRFHGQSSEGARALTISRMNAVMDGLQNYAIDNGGAFPTTRQGLQALLTKPTVEPVPRNWRGPYLDDPRCLRDAWDMPLHYISPGGKDPFYDLWSDGADKREGGGGPDADILSWDLATMVP